MIDATLVTVHGFWSSPATWERLNKAWRADTNLHGLEIHDFEYESPKKPPFPLSTTRIPDFNDIAGILASEYSKVLADVPEIAFVTHSQGGLILQRFLAWMTDQGRAPELRRIRSIVMLACPNGGSEYLRSIRRVLGYGRHAQAGSLEALNPHVINAQSAVLERIVYATGVDTQHCPIPFHVYAGGSDRVVPAQSAKSVFKGAGTIAGNHFSILNPGARGSQTVTVVRRHLIEDLTPRQGSGSDATSKNKSHNGDSRYVVNPPRNMLGRIKGKNSPQQIGWTSATED
jgi:pimeloyl-ACP methyl ester carboxylesterase